MWRYLPEGAFFSRSLAQSGPMLAFNLVLKGPGSVEVGPVELVQFAPDENPLGDSAAWWSGRDANEGGGAFRRLVVDELLRGRRRFMGALARRRTTSTRLELVRVDT